MTGSYYQRVWYTVYCQITFLVNTWARITRHATLPFLKYKSILKCKTWIFSEVKKEQRRSAREATCIRLQKSLLLYFCWLHDIFLVIKKPSPSVSIIGCMVSANSLLYKYYKGRQLWKILFFKTSYWFSVTSPIIT